MPYKQKGQVWDVKSFVNGIKNLKTIAYWRKAKFSGIFAKKDYTKLLQVCVITDLSPSML